MTLTEFLLARIDEDEAWVSGADWLEECQECAFGQQPQSPYPQARLLAECEAKRQMLKYCGFVDDIQDEYAVGLRDEVLSALALPYANHPDYDPEWAL